MYLQEMRSCIEESKRKINELLRMPEENNIFEIIKILNDSEVKRVITRDNQLMILSSICSMWSIEKKIGERTFFDNIYSLEDAEKKYTNMKYYCRRFEYNMPEVYLVEGVEYIENKNISGVALYSIMEIQTKEPADNMVKMAQYLKKYNILSTVLIMLQMAVKKYDKNTELLLELADTWISIGQWRYAYDTLQKIEQPNEDIREIIRNLEEVLDNEKV